MDRYARAFFILCSLLLLLIIGLAVRRCTAGAFTSPKDVEFAQPEQAIRDARAVIADRNVHPEKYESFTAAAALPPSLRIEKLKYAKVHDDHIDLVIARNPDISMGARIWMPQHRPHRDRPTRYRDIWFFRYDNDLPVTVENIP